ncbi:uncharacterized protein LOC122639309 [Telopea speciosissima]|uniref:uncharacterized protein LOC122639309 n=1 Tax=Telopea speciosissima TaxID=54955 RepID=UPI001CC7F757|nr:uncharacterized protein LOC122639309 [Telopea speciosissima]XP_043688069.1 uncharacterized protein LOC122639309 [Telopea speciosissima]XP_043688070.1 uncharacterized protein LOC122639309 [Telopea speciosissima]
MRAIKPWIWLPRSRNVSFDGGTHGFKMKPLPFMVIVCILMVVIVWRTTNYQYQHAEMENRFRPFGTLKDSELASVNLDYLPHGIIQANSDLELKPLWLKSRSRSKVDIPSHPSLLAIPAGIKQKKNVDTIVQKFFAENFTVILFHYDGNVDGWRDLAWNNKVIHIVALNQTKWWFAKRFLHPDVVSIYDYIFLWDEDLGVENFHPGRYLEIMKSEGLEISQPALDPNSTGIHHRITIRERRKQIHRRVYDTRGKVKCSDASDEPPCTGFVEGMAPVFSRSAWRCAWHLIQNDLVHGWGMDMKLGYCAQGDRTKRVGVIDSEFIVHQGIPTLGGHSAIKASKDTHHMKRGGVPAVDVRSEIRRQSTSELQIFRKRWDQAVKEDNKWIDPFKKRQR